MQIKLQKTTQQPVQFSSQQLSYLYEMKQIMNFINPICKQTYQSLPKIYGKNKNKIKIHLPLTKSPHSLHQQLKTISHNNLQTTTKNKQTIKNNTLSIAYSQPKYHSHRIKKAHPYTKLSQKKIKQLHFVTKKFVKINLPQIRKFQFDDLNSQHTITHNFLASKIPSSHSPPPQTKTTQFATIQHNNPSPDQKRKQKLNQKLTHQKSKIQQQSDQQNKTQQNQQQTESKTLKKTTKQHNSSSSPLTFQTTNLNIKYQSSSQQSFFKNKLTQLSTRLATANFTIPDQPHYQQYLKTYKPLNPNFSLPKLLQSPRFTTLRTSQQLYFGQSSSNSIKQGHGITITQKQIYQGQYRQGLKHFGYQQNTDGIYFGGYQNGLRSGPGIFKWNNGEIFQGNWENGMKKGNGTWKSPKGDRYQGEWLQNKQHGYGMFKHRTSTYRGQFKNYLKDGRGVQIFANGDKYDGEYKIGKPCGKGRYEWREGGYYEGQFSQGFRQGKGKWIDVNGNVYQGSFKQDFKHGFGKQILVYGQRFQGEFFQGQRKQGKVYDKNSNCVEIDDN